MTESSIPIWQAPTGSIAGPELCAVVATAGGVGAMGLTWTSPEDARAFVRQVLDALRGARSCFQVNFVLHFEPKALAAVLEEGAPAITFSWGQPGEHATLVRSFGAQMGVQVVNREGARQALDEGADFLVCQGVEAGGHVQSSTPLDVLLPEILDVAGDTPVIAAGGLADGADIARVLQMGASGAMLGTRFVATQESRAHELYKKRLVEADETALTLCFDGGWPHAQHRVLRNDLLARWEAAGSPSPGRRPREGEKLGEEVLAYDDTAPRQGMDGAIEDMCMYAGAGVAKIKDLPLAGDLIQRLWAEAKPPGK